MFRPRRSVLVVCGLPLLAVSCSLIVDVGELRDRDGGESLDADGTVDSDVEFEDGRTDSDVRDDADGEGDDAGALCGNGTVETGEECDDGNTTSGDGCEPLTCQFSCHDLADCDDTDPCTVDSCNTVSLGRACGHAPNPGAVCDDGDPCSHTDRCDAVGACAGAEYSCTPAECESASSCNGDGGCAVTYDGPGTTCDDGNTCTTPDTCDGAGTCSGPNTCGCPGGSDAECSTFEDGNRCNGTLHCVSLRCEVDPATVVTCPANPPCGTYSCTPATGACSLSTLPTGTSCTDGLFCNGAETCGAGGTCTAATVPCPVGGCIAGCSESVDTCSVATSSAVCRPTAPGGCDIAENCDGSSTGCPSDSFATDGTSCSDGNACTGGDACSGGVCVGGPPPSEMCDATDNDCDTMTDEGFGCSLGVSESCTTTCGTTGSRTCGAGCTWGTCAAVEICGNGVDDDCDTATDEGCGGTTIPCTGDAACTPSGLTCNENWGICVVASCTGQPNFKPCELVTTPSDRSYDICVNGTCVSPGCGDATCNAPGPNWTLADTSQRSCYNGSTTVVCSTLGTPGSPACETTAFCGQDAQYGWDVTHTAAERFSRTTGTEPVVTDNVTGLMWMGCSDGRTGDSCTGSNTTYTWTNAVTRCDGRSWGGYTDWRLPDRYELQSIVDYGRSTGPYIDPTAFPATPNTFWSSSSYAGGASSAWYVSFNYGYVGNYDKPSTFFVRCVRRGP